MVIPRSKSFLALILQSYVFRYFYHMSRYYIISILLMIASCIAASPPNTNNNVRKWETKEGTSYYPRLRDEISDQMDKHEISSHSHRESQKYKKISRKNAYDKDITSYDSQSSEKDMKEHDDVIMGLSEKAKAEILSYSFSNDEYMDYDTSSVHIFFILTPKVFRAKQRRIRVANVKAMRFKDAHIKYFMGIYWKNWDEIKTFFNACRLPTVHMPKFQGRRNRKGEPICFTYISFFT